MSCIMEEYTSKMDKLIHLDLKSCPLKVDYLKQLFRLFKEWGGTGLLIEWEDTFPYHGDLVDIGSLKNGTAYSVNDVQEILRAANLNNLTVIPLVQTFGHMEFVLKTDKWRHLREVHKHVSSLCPSQLDSISLVTTMITQIMNLHSGCQFLHVGGDEVWHMGICKNCRHQNKHNLFLKHMLSVLGFVRQNYPQLTPIMWDDMLRNIDIVKLKEFNIGDFVEPMIWEYRRIETFFLASDLWEKYSNVFEKVWIASAFKGAIGSCQVYPIVGHYLSNQEKWLSVVAEQKQKFSSIRGIALTGWSRYDHYATLCELMPTALISLGLCLKTWINGKYDNGVYQEMSQILGFTEETPLILYPVNRPIAIAKSLKFPGCQIYNSIEWFENVKAKFNFVAYSDQAITWLNSWNVKRNHTSVMQVEHIVINFKNLLEEINAVEKHLEKSLTEVYYDNTIEEWLGCYLHPLKDKLLELIKDADSQLRLN